MDHEEEEDADDPQRDSGSIRSTESEEAIEQSSGSPSSEASAKLDDEAGEVFQDNSNTDDNTDVDDERIHGPQSEIRNGEFHFQVKSFHIVNARPGKRQFKCDVCTGMYQHAFSLKRHFLRTHVNYKYLSEADITNCNINMNQVRRRREESDPPPDAPPGEAKTLGLYRCHLCLRLFDLRDELKTHVVSHTDNNNFSCDQCEMTFSHRQNLVRHQSVHSEEKQFICKHCGKRFPTLANQRRHEKTHESSDLPFPCSFCAASFAHAARLQKHLRKHHPEHYYPCDVCPKFFLEKDQLKKHAAAHKSAEGPTSKKCKLPEARVVFKARKRAKGFESENKYLCSICKRRFATYITLCRHKKAAHAAAQPEKRTRTLQPRSEPVVVRSRSSKPVAKEMPEDEFYMTVAHRISENLLYHLDGKSSQLKIKQDQCAFPEEESSKVVPQYSIHNFPSTFDITQMMQIYSNRATSGNNTVSNDGSDNSEETECIFLGGSRQDRSGLHRANGVASARPHRPGENVIGRNVPLTFICSVCAEKFSSQKAIEEHKINNHPNVVCTHIEIEGEKEVPPELCWSLRSPVGFLHSSPVVAPVTAPATGSPVESLVCTKCRSTFLSRGDLHQHILDCGANSDFHKQLTRGYSVHSRLGCSARQLGVPARDGPVRAKRRPHVNESPSAEAKRAKRGACSPQNEEKALDLKVRPRVTTPPKFVPDPVVLNIGQSPEEEQEVVEGMEVAPAEKTTDSVVASESGEGEDKSKGHEVVDKGTTAVEDAQGAEETAALQPSESAQQSSPDKLVGNETDKHTSSPPPPVEKKASAESSSAAEASPKEETAASPREQPREEIRAEADQFQFAENEQAPSPVLDEGRRVLRSKTAAVSARGGASSSAVVNPHTCSTCQRSFMYAASLKKHLRDICPNLKVAGQKVVKKRRAGKMAKKEDPVSEAQVHASAVPGNIEVKKECSDAASSPSLLNLGVFPEDADTSGLELLANASSMERPVSSAAGGLPWAPGNSTPRQTGSSESAKEGGGKVLAPSKVKAKEEAPDAPPDLGEVDVKPDLRPQNREHTCPYCLHSFAYLSNYRKHLREVCLIKKKKEKKSGDGNEAAPSVKASDESHSIVDRADNSSTITMSFKGRIENSVINLLRNQSKQVELIGAQAAAVKDQPGGANHSSPNFMTFSCPVCHKIFLSYVKMLQHRLSHKLQTDEPVVKEEKPDASDTAGSRDVVASPFDESAPAADAIKRPEDIKLPVPSVPIKTEEDQRFDEMLTGKASEASDAENASLREELKREEHNYAAVSLAELDSLPEEDDAEADDAANEKTAQTLKPKDDPAPEQSTETKTKAALPAKKGSLGKRSSESVTGNKLPLPKEKVRRVMRRLSGRTAKAASRDKQ